MGVEPLNPIDPKQLADFTTRQKWQNEQISGIEVHAGYTVRPSFWAFLNLHPAWGPPLTDLGFVPFEGQPVPRDAGTSSPVVAGCAKLAKGRSAPRTSSCLWQSDGFMCGGHPTNVQVKSKARAMPFEITDQNSRHNAE